MYQIKETNTHAHTYIIERFNVVFLIDPSHDYDNIVDIIKTKTLLGILITHAHSDHVDLIHQFDCPIYIHKNDAALLFDDEHNGYYPNKHPYNRKHLNLKLIEDGDRIAFADQYIEVLHLPGHTNGSVGYLYQNKLFSGDLVFDDDIGRYDLYSGNLASLKISIKRIIGLNHQIKVYPGHDKITTIKTLQQKNPYILKWYKQKK